MVFIIESPSGRDLLVDRREGDILSKALSLSGITYNYYLVVNSETLRLAFDEIANEILKGVNAMISLPYIHLSAHGNESGCALTDETFLHWADFEDILARLNDKIGHIHLNGIEISRIVLCMSVCEGFNIKDISRMKPKLFQAVVGNSSPIYWNDALTAFLIFYHSAIIKRTSTLDAVHRMNVGSGVESDFELSVDDDILVK